MATLADVVAYLKAGPNGRPLPLSEVKELTPEDRAELVASLSGMTAEEIEKS
jgi:hypothetical protein